MKTPWFALALAVPAMPGADQRVVEGTPSATVRVIVYEDLVLRWCRARSGAYPHSVRQRRAVH